MKSIQTFKRVKEILILILATFLDIRPGAAFSRMTHLTGKDLVSVGTPSPKIRAL